MTTNPPRELTLNRITYSDEGTPGHIQLDRHCFATMEPPPRDNKPGISCIPPGRYLCEPIGTPHYPKHYVIADVPGRSGIVIHAGNYAGDPEKGWQTDTQGCILLGRSASLLNTAGRRQRAVVLSRSSIKAFSELLQGAPFWLTINPPLSDGGIIWPPDALLDEEQQRWRKRMAP